jgi:hypothetical protein
VQFVLHESKDLGKEHNRYGSGDQENLLVNHLCLQKETARSKHSAGSGPLENDHPLSGTFQLQLQSQAHWQTGALA